MANQLSSSGKVKLWENPDLRKRFLFLLGALIVFRIGAHVPVPGVDATALAQLYKDQGGGILDYLDAPIQRITTADTPAPYSPALLQEWLPNAQDVIKAVKKVMYK